MIDAGIDAYWCRMPVYPATGLPQVGLTCQGAIPTADLRRELQAGERWSPLDGHALGHHGSPVKDWHLKECNWWLGQSLLVDGQFLLILQYHKPTKKPTDKWTCWVTSKVELDSSHFLHVILNICQEVNQFTSMGYATILERFGAHVLPHRHPLKITQ
jgi:hypothetical protein